MDKLPSTLCIHKRADGVDNRFSGLDGRTVTDPLRAILGAPGYGRFQQSEGQPYAYIPLRDMWSEEVEEPEESSSDDATQDEATIQKESSSEDSDSITMDPYEQDTDDSEQLFSSADEGSDREMQQNRDEPMGEAKGSSDPLNRRVSQAKPAEQPKTSRSTTSLPTSQRKTRATREPGQVPPAKRVQWQQGVKPPANLEDSNEIEDMRDELYEAFCKSHDKVIFIKFKPKGAASYTWAVVQIDPDETDARKAKTKGVYRCRWFGPHPDDIKRKSIRNSRFWPVIHRIDGDGFFREQQIVSPDKVHGFLEKKIDMGWYQLDVNLKKHRLSEPFNFVSLPVTQMSDRLEKWRIDNKQWNPLIMRAYQR